MHHMKGKNCKMEDVGAVWAGMPPDVKAAVTARCQAVR